MILFIQLAMGVCTLLFTVGLAGRHRQNPFHLKWMAAGVMLFLGTAVEMWILIPPTNLSAPTLLTFTQWVMAASALAFAVGLSVRGKSQPLHRKLMATGIFLFFLSDIGWIALQTSST